jgi:hypothetical protein
VGEGKKGRNLIVDSRTRAVVIAAAKNEGAGTGGLPVAVEINFGLAAEAGGHVVERIGRLSKVDGVRLRGLVETGYGGAGRIGLVRYGECLLGAGEPGCATDEVQVSLHAAGGRFYAVK